jgi:hypothetical protein
VSNQHRVLRFELGGNRSAQPCFFGWTQGLRLLGVKMSLNQKAFGNLCHVRRTSKRAGADVECTPEKDAKKKPQSHICMGLTAF